MTFNQRSMSKTVDEAVVGYVSSWKSDCRPLSTRDAVHAIRAAVPHAEHTDSELAELIAAAAVRAGHTIYFCGPRDIQSIGAQSASTFSTRHG
jgi:hypothetical protein